MKRHDFVTCRLENYESPAKGAAPFAATRSSTVVQEEQSLKTELEWAGRKFNNGGMALEPDGPTPRVLHAARTSSASNGFSNVPFLASSLFAVLCAVLILRSVRAAGDKGQTCRRRREPARKSIKTRKSMLIQA